MIQLQDFDYQQTNKFFLLFWHLTKFPSEALLGKSSSKLVSSSCSSTWRYLFFLRNGCQGISHKYKKTCQANMIMIFLQIQFNRTKYLAVHNKALNRENRLECIQQTIILQFDYSLRALVHNHSKSPSHKYKKKCHTNTKDMSSK